MIDYIPLTIDLSDPERRRRLNALLNHLYVGTRHLYRSDDLVLVLRIESLRLKQEGIEFRAITDGNGSADIDGGEIVLSGRLEFQRICNPPMWHLYLDSRMAEAFSKFVSKVSSRSQRHALWFRLFQIFDRHRQERSRADEWVKALWCDMNPHEVSICRTVLENSEEFIQWPEWDFLFRACVRKDHPHVYDASEPQLAQSAGIELDGRSNGPAIAAYLLAGGKRPGKRNGHGWSVHHIYDGQFPFPEESPVLHAVQDPRHFARSGGLVALHPVADALASEYPAMAWTLREQAFLRFDYDPDDVFRRAAQRITDAEILSEYRHWTGNDKNGNHHHGVVPLSPDTIDLRLDWHILGSKTLRRIGTYRLDLFELLRRGYIRFESYESVRLRFVHAGDGAVFIQVKDGAPGLKIS